MYNFLMKKKVVIFCILSLTLIANMLYLGVNNGEFYSIPDADIDSQPNTEKSNEPLVYECCVPLNSSLRTKLFFLKIHKTASSTLQNIILRFALRHTLDVLCTNYYLYYLPFSNLSIVPYTQTSNNKYHIWAYHAIYNYEKLKSYQYPNTKMITLMRHPARLFQSIFEYFRVNDSIGMTFTEFLNAPVKPAFFVVPTSWTAYRGYNQMSFDLGFDLITNAKNQTAIEQFIEKIDREFDFVMITEYFEASLVLLANLMGWPLEYVTHLPINSTPRDPSDIYTLTPRDKLILMELNSVDTQLYHHFLKKFLKCVEQYGEEKLQRQVYQLKMMNAQLRERCVAKLIRGTGMNAIEYVPKNASDLECRYAINNEPEMEITTIVEQTKRLMQLPNQRIV